MTGKNIPSLHGENIIETAGAHGFHTTVNYLFLAKDGISTNIRIDSNTPAPLISGRVILHHPTHSGLASDVLTFCLTKFLTKLRKWAKIFTRSDPRVNIYPKAIIQDHGPAESLVCLYFNYYI